MIHKYKRNRQQRSRRRAAAAAEFAIIAPVLFLTAMGMFELGRVLSVQQVMTNAAREGAREAVLGDATEESVTSVVNGYLANIMNQEVDVAITPDITTVGASDYITVTVTADVLPMSGFGSIWMGSEFLVTAECTMRCEGFD